VLQKRYATKQGLLHRRATIQFFELCCGATDRDVLLTETCSCSQLYSINHRTGGESGDTSLKVVE
jgi:hypothetical protein